MSPHRNDALIGLRTPVFRDGDALPTELLGATIAVGNFDGCHRGHQALMAAARESASARGSAAAILTFEPHPRLFFAPDEPYFRLTPEPVKLKIVSAFGMDAAFIRRFDAALAATSARSFVDDILAGELAAAEVVIGSDFHFGRGREGTPAMLAELARERGIGCRLVEAVKADGAVVSSSRVRAALEAGHVAVGNGLLGYRWFVAGEVVHGEKRGRDLGFPTANLRLGADCRLRHGIYAVRMALAPGEVRDGVASFGRRPTFDNGAPLLETFLFDYAGDLYGRHVEVEFVAWLRGEERFDDVEALVRQMDQDAVDARRVLAEPPDMRSLIG